MYILVVVVFFLQNKWVDCVTSVSLWLQHSSGANDNVICASRCAGALPSRLNWMTSCLMYRSKCGLHYNLINLFLWAFLTWLFQSTCVLHRSSQAGAKARLGGWANFSTGTRMNDVGASGVYLLNFFFDGGAEENVTSDYTLQNLFTLVVFCMGFCLFSPPLLSELNVTNSDK